MGFLDRQWYQFHSGLAALRADYCPEKSRTWGGGLGMYMFEAVRGVFAVRQFTVRKNVSFG